MKAESKRSVRIMLQWLLSAATVLMAALLIWQCVTIYHEGIAPENMGENGLRIHDIYSREIVTAHFASIAWSVWVFLALLAANLFGTGWIFTISADNVYHRGPLNSLLYLLLFGYYAESVWQVHKAKRDGVTVEFFSVYYFVITCAVGTVLQGAFYGMAFGWLSVAIAFVFVDSQLRSLRSYIDELSGLFGRKYMNYCLERIHATQEKDVYGIMMDVNCFKEINDTYGHAEGDRAIQEIGHILSGALVANSVAIRMSGDEFMVLIRHGSEEILDKTCTAIEQRVQHYNATAPAGSFQLSFSTGVAKYEGGSVEKFLVELDERMYVEKRAFHAARDGHAAPE